MSKSKAICTPKKKKIKKATQTITSKSGYVFKVSLRVNTPNTKLFSAEIVQVPEKETTTAAPKTTTAAPKTTTAPTKTTSEGPVKKETNPPSLPGEWVVIQQG